MTNSFLLFDENKNNIQSDYNYSGNEERTNGMRSGIAYSWVHNKVLYQTSLMTQAIGDVIGEASDSDSVDTLKDGFIAALNVGIKDYSSGYEFSEGEVVSAYYNSEWRLFTSNIDNNIGNDLSDTTAWTIHERYSWGDITGTLADQTDLSGALSELGASIDNVNTTITNQINTINQTITELEARRYVTSSYVSGTSWYRIYSDGWKVQGGDCGTSGDTNTTITFLVAFSNANYYIRKNMGYGSTGGTATRWIGFWDLSTTGATTGSLGSGYYQRWIAMGY